MKTILFVSLILCLSNADCLNRLLPIGKCQTVKQEGRRISYTFVSLSKLRLSQARKLLVDSVEMTRTLDARCRSKPLSDIGFQIQFQKDGEFIKDTYIATVSLDRGKIRYYVATVDGDLVLLWDESYDKALLYVAED